MTSLNGIRGCFLLIALGLVAPVVRAESLAAVRARIEQRVEGVVRLKARLLVGENNAGYLEARGALAAAEQRVVTDENADRGLVYAAIAAQNKSAPEEVGRARASKLAAEARGGEWVQDRNGQWRKKN